MGNICCMVEGGDGSGRGEAAWVMLFLKCTENECVPGCRKCKKCKKRSHTILWKIWVTSQILSCLGCWCS